MAAQKKAGKINLLPQEGFAQTTFGRVITWALSGFRVIVIVVELVVMAAFVSRFWLDAKINDLNDVIKQKQALIAAQSEFEKTFRDVQKRISVFSEVQALSPITPSSEIERVTTLLPADIILSSFSIAEGKINVKGVAASEISVAQLMANLEGSGQYQEVLLTTVGNNQKNEALIEFTLELTPKSTQAEKKK